MKRRSFIQGLQAGVPLLLASSSGHDVLAAAAPQVVGKAGGGMPKELACDVLVIGGGLGGCATALAAARNGCRVIMTEETDWIGGQLTQQAVPSDEHPWIERFGCTRAYRNLRTAIRDYYRRNYPLTAEARERWNLNPGSGSVSAICHEPRVSLAVLHEMLAPLMSGMRLTILLESKPVAASVNGDSVESVTVRSLESGSETTITAPYILDATELGDLLPMTGTEYITGSEARGDTGEPHATETHEPLNIQACTWCFAMDHIEGEDHTIEKPAEYDFWRAYVPEMDTPWPGPLFAWRYSHPATLKPRDLSCDPIEESANRQYGFWRYRRIAYKGNFAPGTYESDITLVNWPMNDYWLGNLLGIPEDEADRNRERAKQLSLSLIHWMQTECPREDGKSGYPGLRLRGDICGTEHGLAKYPYIREARRIQAEFTVLEQHVGTEARMQATGLPREEVRAESFHDSVGVGSYRIDLHPSTGKKNYVDISSLPFQIPLGSLIPVRMENLIPACKNLGVTHITNGCYRLHPVEWNIGEAAGALAAYCLDRKHTPRQVRATDSILRDFQRWIGGQGFELDWPKTSPR